jgi:type VI secretion system secreted protein Hcp
MTAKEWAKDFKSTARLVSMAVDVFLRIDGITGESQNASFKGQIQLESASFHASQTVNIGSVSSGAGAGKVVLGPLTVTKLPDSTSPQIFVALAQGTPAATATLSFVQSGATSAYLTIDLGLVAFSGMSTNVTGGVPLEAVTMSYGRLKYTVQVQGSTGVTKSVSGGWDGIKNVKM